ncbi:MAG: lipopolysaccharide heptosyltransferase I [Acidobacteriaceae bacterium]
MLIVRIGAMGDILHALPAVSALRAAHPDWQIDWAVEPRWMLLLSATASALPRTAAMPLVDHIYEVPTKAWRKRPFAKQTRREILDLRRALRSQQYDLCLDLQGSIRSAVVGHLARAEAFVGALHPREAPARWFYSQRVLLHKPHVIEQACEIAGTAVDAALLPAKAMLPVDEAAEAWCASKLQQMGGKGFVVMNPGAGWGAKRWPVEHFGAVAEGLAMHGFVTLVNAGPGEEALAEAVVAASNKTAQMIFCSIGQLTSFLRHASLFLGGDTGPLHLAAALQCPVVGIYGPTDPARNGPYGTKNIVLRHPESKLDHSRHAAPEAGLLTITPQAVLDAALTLLHEPHQHSSSRETE